MKEERKEGGGGIGHTFGVGSKGFGKGFLSLTGLKAGGFLSLTAFQAEGYGIALRAMLIKSALRDWLSVSYGMISILRIGSLRSPPPIRLRRTFPHPGNRINRSMLSCGDMAPWLSIHSAPACGGKVVAPATKGGMPFLARRAVVKVLYKLAPSII